MSLSTPLATEFRFDVALDAAAAPGTFAPNAADFAFEVDNSPVDVDSIAFSLQSGNTVLRCDVTPVEAGSWTNGFQTSCTYTPGASVILRASDAAPLQPFAEASTVGV